VGLIQRQNQLFKPLNPGRSRSKKVCGADRGKKFFTAAESGLPACE